MIPTAKNASKTHKASMQCALDAGQFALTFVY